MPKGFLKTELRELLFAQLREIKAISVLKNYVAENMSKQKIVINKNSYRAVLSLFRKQYNEQVDFADELKLLIKELKGSWAPAQLYEKLSEENERLAASVRKVGDEIEKSLLTANNNSDSNGGD